MMKQLTKTSVLALFALLMFAFTDAQEKKEGIFVISADELLKLQTSGVKVVDVRTTGEVKQGKIPGALHIELSADLISKMAAFDKEQPVIVYCQVGGRSGRAAEQLKGAGFKTVYNYGGGMVDWRNKGKKVE